MAETDPSVQTPKLVAVPNADSPLDGPEVSCDKPADDAAGKDAKKRGTDDDKPAFIVCNDRDYVRQLRVVLKIKELLVSEAVNLDEKDRNLVRLGVLNSLRYSRRGHSPPREAWDELDARLQGLTPYLKDDTGELKRKLQVRLAPGFLYWLPLVMALLAAVSLCIAIAPPQYSILSALIGWKPSHPLLPQDIEGVWRFSAFLVWLIALGSLGSLAFLYVNVLSIETDKSVDVTSASVVALRIILGGLFGLVIGLPIGYINFVHFCFQISQAASTPANALPDALKVNWADGLALLLPFLLGFSTPLVLNVLNRCIDGVQTLFGMQPKT